VILSPALLFVAGALAAPRSRYGGEIAAAAAWVDRQQLPDGAVLYGSNEIEPYFANVAATGLATQRAQLPRVRAWMQWYVAHLNVRDRWGLRGTIYDYRYAHGVETSLRRADSVDSYAATFFTLARAAYDGGDAPSQAYVRSIRPRLEEMAEMLEDVAQADGMTVALPDHPVAYLMDNAEVYRGLSDLAYLERRAFARAPEGAAYDARARRVAAGIATLWSSANGTYDSSKQEPSGPQAPSHWSVWYPDATAQLFPALQGVVPAASPRASALWTAFNAAWPAWDRLINGDPGGFPWALTGATAVVVGDRQRAAVFASSVERRYARAGFPYPWYDLEAGWYLRTLSRLDAPGAPGLRE